MRVADLESQVGGRVPNFLRRIYRHLKSNETLTDDDVVVVEDMEYFKKLEGVLAKTRDDMIQNYLGWRMMQGLGEFASSKFRDLQLAFKRVQTGVEKLQGMDRRCLDLLSDIMPDLVGRTYVDNLFTRSDKEIADQMIERILDRFKGIVGQKKWMDERTRANSIEKASKILVNTAFPDWLLRDEQLELEYDFVSRSMCRPLVPICNCVY